jgi:FtsZ-binding cell division protein ZapB
MSSEYCNTAAERIKILVMDLEETATRNDSAGEDQQQCNRQTDQLVEQLQSRI